MVVMVCQSSNDGGWGGERRPEITETGGAGSMVLVGMDGGTGVRGGGRGWLRRAGSGKMITGCRGGGDGGGGAKGLVKWERKDSENFRVNMLLSVYSYTTTSLPLDLQGASCTNLNVVHWSLHCIFQLLFTLINLC